MSLDRFGAALSLKTVDAPQRVIAGWAAVAANIDRVGDVIDPAANAKAAGRVKPSEVGVFIGHDMSSLPVGIPVRIEADAKGLYVETYVFPGPFGDQILGTAASLLEHGQTLGMSIGYRVRDSRPDRVDGKLVRRLLDYDLIEYSFAARQAIANPEALVTGVKTGGGMHYRVEKMGDRWHVMRGDGEKALSLADYPTEDEALEKAAALNGEDGKALALRRLPDAAFLYVAPGGQLDDEGKTVPRGFRHFRYRDGDGAIDAALLRDAVREIPEAKTTGLDAGALARLGARARRLLEAAERGDADAADGSQWKAGIHLDVRAAGYALLDLSEGIASEQQAMAALGIDVKAGQRARLESRDRLRAVVDGLKALVAAAEEADRDDDPRAAVEWYRQWFEMAAPSAAQFTGEAVHA